MSSETSSADRRKFLADGARIVGVAAAGSLAALLATRRGHASGMRWQIDPEKCIACTNCATQCVLDESAVKAVQCFDLCGYCDICTGYFDPQYRRIDTAAENQLCPTGAVIRTYVEEKAGQQFYEYTIDEARCIGCGKCVKGCALMNGSLYLQVMHDRCVDCNECAIAVACPSQAFLRVPAERPYRMKRLAAELVKKKARDLENKDARKLLERVDDS